MRGALTVSVMVGCFAVNSAAPLARTGQSATGACSLLTKEVVTQVSPRSKESLNLTLSIPPQEDKVGQGSACSYGGITLQIDVVTPAGMEKVRDKTWVPVANVGDTAYFRDNRGMFAELYVQAGKRTLTIQMSPGPGKTVQAIQPNAIALAKALLPKLK